MSVAWPLIPAAGLIVGMLMGLFGVGGSSVATPMLSMLGVPSLAAIASPLAATIPSALSAALPYVRGGDARPRAAAWTLVGAIPATVVGSILAGRIGGGPLLMASGIVLVLVGIRVVLPIDDVARQAGTRRRHNRPLGTAARSVDGGCE